MRRIEDLNREELLALTDEEIKRFIDIECAHEGISILGDPPNPPIAPEQKRNLTLYKVGDIYFGKKEEAEAVVQLLARATLYSFRYLGGYWDSNFRYAEPTTDVPQIQIENFFDEAEIRAVKSKLETYVAEKKVYDRRKDEYEKQVAATESCSSKVYDRISEAREYKDELDHIVRTYNKYLDLAEGDRKIAWNFFESALPKMNLQYNHEALLDTYKPIGEIKNEEETNQTVI